MSSTTVYIAILLSLLIGCFSYDQYKKRAELEQELVELFDRLNQLQNHIERANQIVAEREKDKKQSTVKIKQLEEQIKHALNDNKCASERVPVDVVKRMQISTN